MNEEALADALTRLPLGEIRYFDTIGSTNDEALIWANAGAPDLSLIVADEQTRGRGRMKRAWFTPPQAALAFSLILRPVIAEQPHLSKLVGLAALSIVQALEAFGISAQIKWPNDILIHQRKAAGILTELIWSGEQAACAVIGVGLNVTKQAVPNADVLTFPAISLEDALGRIIPREELIRDILTAFIELRPQLSADALIHQWNKTLAYRGERVGVEVGAGQTLTGSLDGLLPDGSLCLRGDNGKRITVHFGDVRLRPFADILER
ncbi:MAG: biotin--[acetyl-CoA-carboxylase] ligase [Anaerolineales bacterium]|nr:biotin--[acetyl-CoA-carboxylase] ligase [Anaerolineales bacterium]